MNRQFRNRVLRRMGNQLQFSEFASSQTRLGHDPLIGFDHRVTPIWEMIARQAEAASRGE